MRDPNSETGGPTNGETDGDDADIYRKASDGTVVELCASAVWLFRKIIELVEATTFAMPALSGMNSERERLVYDKYAERLSIMAKLAIFQLRELTEVAEQIADLLMFSDAPQAKEHAEKLKAVLRGRKPIPKPPPACG